MARRSRRRGTVATALHHFRMPGEHEEEDESRKPETDQDLNDHKEENRPVEKRCPPNPVDDDTEDRDWLEDRQHQIDDVWVVEVIMIRQPAAGDEVPIDGDRSDQ